MSSDDAVTVRLQGGFSKVVAVYDPDRQEGYLTITKQKQRHQFGSGYESVGPKRTVFSGPIQDANYVASALDELEKNGVFGDGE